MVETNPKYLISDMAKARMLTKKQIVGGDAIRR